MEARRSARTSLGPGRLRVLVVAVLLLSVAPGALGALSFSSPQLASGSATVIRAANMNGDGFPDLVGLDGSSVRVWLGDGTGKFAASTAFPLPAAGS